LLKDHSDKDRELAVGPHRLDDPLGNF
jgi:hypothetical protein